MKRRIINKLFPLGSKRHKFVRGTLQALNLRTFKPLGYYDSWMHQQFDSLPLNVAQAIPTDGPLISVVVPAYNTPPVDFYKMVYSIVSQSYQNWELVLVNASTNEASIKMMADTAQIDTRIRVIPFPNKYISRNTNKGIQEARGEYVAFVDHDDMIEPFALEEVAKVLTSKEVDMVYSDEDKISATGDFYFDPHFKPDWSPDLLTHVNYTNHLSVIRKSLLDKLGGLNPAKDGAQDYDLILRITDETKRIHHIPKVLYHWRAAASSTATNFASKGNIIQAGVNALKEHFDRIHADVTVTAKADRPGFYEIKPRPPKAVSIIIAPFASDALLRLYVTLFLERTDTSEVAIELIVPAGVEPREDRPRCKVVILPATPDFLQKALHVASHDNVICINQVHIPQQRDWLSAMGGLLGLQHVGAAMPIVLRDHTVVEDCGLVMYGDGNVRPLFVNEPYLSNQTFFGNTSWVRNVNALTGSFVLARRQELAAYCKRAPKHTAPMLLLKDFTYQQTEQGKYCVVFSEVVFDTYSIRIKPTTAVQANSFFNENLVQVGNSFEIYTPETAAINILLRLQEQGE